MQHHVGESYSRETAGVLANTLVPILAALETSSQEAAVLASQVISQAMMRVRAIHLEGRRTQRLDYRELNEAYAELDAMTEEFVATCRNVPHAVFDSPQLMDKLHALRSKIDALEAGTVPTIEIDEPLFAYTAKENLTRTVFQTQLFEELKKCQSSDDFYAFLNLWVHLEILRLPPDSIAALHNSLRAEVLQRCDQLFHKDPSRQSLRLLIQTPELSYEYIQ